MQYMCCSCSITLIAEPACPCPSTLADEAAGDFFFNEAEVVAGLGPEERAAFLAQQVNFAVNIADEAQVGSRVWQQQGSGGCLLTDAGHQHGCQRTDRDARRRGRSYRKLCAMLHLSCVAMLALLIPLSAQLG